jgi:hypothetical protein
MSMSSPSFQQGDIAGGSNHAIMYGGFQVKVESSVALSSVAAKCRLVCCTINHGIKLAPKNDMIPFTSGVSVIRHGIEY